MFLFWTICNGQPYLKYCLFYNEEVDLYIFLSIDVKHHFRMPPTSLEEEHSTFHLRLQSVSKFLLVLNFPMNWLKCSCHCCLQLNNIGTAEQKVLQAGQRKISDYNVYVPQAKLFSCAGRWTTSRA